MKNTINKIIKSFEEYEELSKGEGFIKELLLFLKKDNNIYYYNLLQNLSNEYDKEDIKRIINQIKLN